MVRLYLLFWLYALVIPDRVSVCEVTDWEISFRNCVSFPIAPEILPSSNYAVLSGPLFSCAMQLAITSPV